MLLSVAPVDIFPNANRLDLYAYQFGNNSTTKKMVLDSFYTYPWPEDLARGEACKLTSLSLQAERTHGGHSQIIMARAQFDFQ